LAKPLNALIVEDSERDAALLVRELRRGGYDVTCERVDTEPAMRAAIERQSWDIVLSDYSMPKFSALAALALVVEMGLDIPFIIVSGSLGEETAVSIMRSGVHDFVLKDNMKRLIPAIARELDAARIRRERRAANKILDFERKLLQQLMDGSPDAISFKDLSRRYIRLNAAERRTLNVERDEEVRGQTADRFISAERAKLRRDDEERVLATGKPVFDSIERIVGEDGSVRWLSATRAPIRAASGEIAGIVAIARDITESKRQEKMKNEFIATVNHELRTPLTSIIGAIRLLGRPSCEVAPDASKRLLVIANENCYRLASIVNDILDFERIESGRMPCKLQSVSLGTLLERAVESSRVTAQSYGVRVRLDNAAAEIVITTDPYRLGQIVSNLLSNAVRFSPAGSEVVAKLEETLQMVRISVRDQGPGIPPEYRERIFEKFVQVDATDARKTGGTGLGLAIAKQIALQLGGDIHLETALNEGSTFYVEIPRR
jgi:hypothetical protein